MKILHINSYYSTTKLYTEMYRYQREANIPFQVYVPISNQYPDEKLKIDPNADITISRCYNQYDRYIFQIKHQKILTDLLERFNPDDYTLLHAHSLFSNGWLAYQLHKKYHLPYIVAVRSTDEHTFFEKMPWMRRTGINILSHASKIIFISKNTQKSVMKKYIPKHLHDEFFAKSIIIPNGIDDYWHENRNTDKLPIIHEPLRIISVGRLHQNKRLIPLAEMTSLYHENYRPVELHIVGPSENVKIEKELSRFNHVIYHGPKSKKEILLMYRKMDIFALLSSPETFGLVYVEAMSQGLPLVYTRDEGFDGYFKNGHVGVSVHKNDYIAFNQAIDHIYNHYATFSHHAIEESIQFNWGDITQTYKEIYKAL